MTKRIAKPRAHSQCGNLLDSVVLCEVIPATFYYFQDKKYIEEDIPDNLPDLTTEYHCTHCNEKITREDLSYFLERLKENNTN